MQSTDADSIGLPAISLSMISALRLPAVISVGVKSCVGVPNRVVSAFGVSPFRSATATSAAAPATISLGLLMVLYWSPAMMSCSPAMVASLPVTGGTGSTPAALKAAIAPPAVPSLAATTPTIFLRKREIWPPTHCCAFAGVQSGVSYSASVR